MIKIVGKYKDNEEYLKHQAEKVERQAVREWLKDYDVRYRGELANRLLLVTRGSSVLCLGARIGTEVRAFIDSGCFAVGLDLNPLNADRIVLRGDFHELIYADSSIDVVFTNSFDHVLNRDIFANEIRRVLKPGGLFILEAPMGYEEGGSHGEFGVIYWDSIVDVIEFFSGNGFDVVSGKPYYYPDKGEQITFRVNK